MQLPTSKIVTFQSQDREGFLVSMDLVKLNANPDAEQILIKWLEDNHSQIFWDIELHSGGSVSFLDCGNGIEITFSGDNGIFQLEQVKSEIVNF